MNNNLQELFLSYLEDSLAEDLKHDLELKLKEDIKLNEEYQEFVKTYQALNFMNSKNVKAPEGFDLEVMKVIENLSPVKIRSSVMSSIENWFNKVFSTRRFVYVLAPSFASIAIIMIIFKGQPDSIEMLHKNSKVETGDVASNNANEPVQLVTGVNAPSDGTAFPLVSKLENEAKGGDPKVAAKEGLKPEDQFTDLIIAFKNDIQENRKQRAETGAQLNRTEKDAESFGRKKARIFEGQPENFKQVQGELDQLAGRISQGPLGKSTKKEKFPVTYANTSAGSPPAEHFAGNFEADKSLSDNQERLPSAVSAKENSYQAALSIPLSTFSIDVDTASYSNIRKYLSSSQLPPKDVVRIEELLNYFKYDYKVPATKDVPFSLITELASAPWEPKHKLLHIGLKGYEEDASALPASNLVFLIDVSGSMDSPDKLSLLKQGFRLLVDQLRSQDRIAIVVYAGAAGVVLDSKDGNQKTEILSALDKLSAGGSTAGGAGIDLAYKIAKDHFVTGGNNRVILATDGDFNVGVSSDQELVKLIEEKRKSGIFLSVLGFGTGNYQDSKMEQLANKGNGNYAYIDSILEAKKVLVNDFKGTLFTIAKDVKIQIEFNPAYVQAYRLIGYENRMLAKEDFNDDKKDAGELGAGHSVTALYEIVPVGVEFNQTPSVDALKYQQVEVSASPVATPILNLNDELATIKLRYKLPDGDQSKLISQVVNSSPVGDGETSNNFRFSASVAEFGMLLKGSEYKGNASFASAMALAKGAKGDDGFGYRSDYIKLVETAGLLVKE